MGATLRVIWLVTASSITTPPAESTTVSNPAMSLHEVRACSPSSAAAGIAAERRCQSSRQASSDSRRNKKYPADQASVCASRLRLGSTSSG
jgi:hypothetical protein